MKLSLNLKVSGFILLCVLALGTLSTLFFIYSYREGVRREVIARGITMAESLARSIDEALATENLDLIAQMHKIDYVRDVVLAQVFSNLWLPYDAYPEKDFGLPPAGDAIRHFTVSQEPYCHQEAGFFEFYSPVFYHQFDKSGNRRYIIGYVRLKLSPERAEATLRKSLSGYLIIMVLVTGGTIAVLTSFVRKTVIRPLEGLQQSVAASVHQDLPQPVPVYGNDEIGELSREFNEMCAALMERDDLLHEQTVQLEEEVAERQMAQEALQEQAVRLEEEVAERQAAQETLQEQAALLEQEIAERQAAQEALAVKQGQLESLNRSLEERIATTLSELREKDQILIQQGRLAAMGDMISNIAHQWRNPLNNVALIIQNLQLMSESGELTAEAMTREVGCAMDIITFMSRTIDDFRNFFRQDKEKSRFVVNRAVEDAIRLLSPGLASRGIRIELEAEGDVTALGYANEYAQVILNVINNARDVLTERHIVNPLVTIRIFRTEQRSVVLIRDNAGGIGEAILPKLFDPYFTTKAQGQGTGIGLYMSKVIIEQHMDGRILAGNVEGGAEFSIEV